MVYCHILMQSISLSSSLIIIDFSFVFLFSVNITNNNILLIRKEGLWFPVCSSEWLLAGSQLQWVCTASGQGSVKDSNVNFQQKKMLSMHFLMFILAKLEKLQNRISYMYLTGFRYCQHTTTQCPERKV